MFPEQKSSPASLYSDMPLLILVLIPLQYQNTVKAIGILSSYVTGHNRAHPDSQLRTEDAGERLFGATIGLHKHLKIDGQLKERRKKTLPLPSKK